MFFGLNIKNQKGISLVEVLVAAMLFCIMVAGIAKLISSTFTQHRLDMKQQLAALAVNNGAERLIAYVRDHCGTASFSGDSAGACDSNGKLLTPDLAPNPSSANSPIPSDLLTLCPGCQLDIRYTCDNTFHLWNGYVRIIDTNNNNEILASVSPKIMQAACN